jgi:hypothetical protein
MQELPTYMPEVALLLEVEPGELAGKILFQLRKRPPGRGLHFGTSISNHSFFQLSVTGLVVAIFAPLQRRPSL